MTSATDWKLKEERRRWIVDAMDAGLNYTQAAEALGVTPAAVWLAVNKPDPVGIPCTARGVSYPSIAAAALALGISPSNARAHLRRYGNLDRAGNGNSLPVSVRGQVFASRKAAAKAFGVTPSTVSSLLSRQGHLDTLGTGSGNHGNKSSAAKPILIGDVRYPSITAFAEAAGVTPKLAQRWVREGKMHKIMAAAARIEQQRKAA